MSRYKPEHAGLTYEKLWKKIRFDCGYEMWGGETETLTSKKELEGLLPAVIEATDGLMEERRKRRSRARRGSARGRRRMRARRRRRRRKQPSPNLLAGRKRRRTERRLGKKKKKKEGPKPEKSKGGDA